MRYSLDNQYLKPHLGHGNYSSADLKLLQIAGSLLVFYLFFSSLGLLRLFGFSGIVPVLLIGYRILDFTFIGLFVFFWRKKIVFRQTDALLFLIILYPMFIGAFRENFGMTFLNDLVIFLAFFLRVVILRTLIVSALKHTRLDEVFTPFLLRLSKISIGLAIVLFILVQFAVGAGWQTYYQVPLEVTFVLGYSIASGNLGYILFFLIFSVVSGKRMILISTLFTLMVALLWAPNLRRVLVRWFPVIGFFIFFLAVSGSYLLGTSNLVFVNKITYSYKLFTQGISNGGGLDEFFIIAMPDRYIEYRSLLPHLNGENLIFGNGYGFRYVLDHISQKEFGLGSEYHNVTNAHFTPIAIVAKFGIIGLVGWSLFFFSAFRGLRSKVKHSVVSTAALLALVSLLVQSLFAYGLFLNPFTPFIFAIASVVPRRASQ